MLSAHVPHDRCGPGHLCPHNEVIGFGIVTSITAQQSLMKLLHSLSPALLKIILLEKLLRNSNIMSRSVFSLDCQKVFRMYLFSTLPQDGVGVLH